MVLDGSVWADRKISKLLGGKHILPYPLWPRLGFILEVILNPRRLPGFIQIKNNTFI
jgi:hypothetical protein